MSNELLSFGTVESVSQFIKFMSSARYFLDLCFKKETKANSKSFHLPVLNIRKTILFYLEIESMAINLNFAFNLGKLDVIEK